MIQAELVKQVGDTTAVGTAFAAFFHLLPDITAVFALIYLLIRMYETETVQKWRGRKRRK